MYHEPKTLNKTLCPDLSAEVLLIVGLCWSMHCRYFGDHGDGYGHTAFDVSIDENGGDDVECDVDSGTSGGVATDATDAIIL